MRGLVKHHFPHNSIFHMHYDGLIRFGPILPSLDLMNNKLLSKWIGSNQQKEEKL